jgi:serine/threonine protein phosphatase PrpC
MGNGEWGMKQRPRGAVPIPHFPFSATGPMATPCHLDGPAPPDNEFALDANDNGTQRWEPSHSRADLRCSDTGAGAGAEVAMTTSEHASSRATHRKPTNDEIDVHGLTHIGKVRTENQDHFLIGSLHKQIQVFATSLAETDLKPVDDDRLAFLAMVADGVGGGAAGEEASRFTLEAVSAYLTRSMHCYYTADPSNDQEFAKTLEDAAMRCHSELAEASDSAFEGRRATTLTLFLGVWPRAYVLQVGDSRYYLLRDGELRQVSRDQTMAQELIDLGIFKRHEPAAEKWSHVLSSAIGGQQTSPVVTGVENDWGYVHLLCSDGLTRHVSDERIRERLVAMTSAKQVCEDLLQDALDDGGTDNVTIIVGRTIRRHGE